MALLTNVLRSQQHPREALLAWVKELWNNFLYASSPFNSLPSIVWNVCKLVILLEVASSSENTTLLLVFTKILSKIFSLAVRLFFENSTQLFLSTFQFQGCLSVLGQISFIKFSQWIPNVYFFNHSKATHVEPSFRKFWIREARKSSF